MPYQLTNKETNITETYSNRTIMYSYLDIKYKNKLDRVFSRKKLLKFEDEFYLIERIEIIKNVKG